MYKAIKIVRAIFIMLYLLSFKKKCSKIIIKNSRVKMVRTLEKGCKSNIFFKNNKNMVKARPDIKEGWQSRFFAIYHNSKKANMAIIDIVP